MSKVSAEDYKTFLRVKNILADESAKSRLEDYLIDECRFSKEQREQILAEADYTELAENFEEELNDYREDEIWSSVFDSFLCDWCYDHDIEF